MPVRILIADYYEDNRELLRLILLAADYEVLEARDGEECLTLAQLHLPELLMIDLSMPKLDGWEVLQALRGNRLTRDIPCVAVTAYADTDRNRALQAGFNAYLTKPFRVGRLLEVVASLIAGRAPRVSIAEAGGEN